MINFPEVFQRCKFHARINEDSGLRLLESLRLRVKDLDFEHRAIVVRDGKDRVLTLPDELVTPRKRHLANRKTLFERDSAAGMVGREIRMRRRGYT